MQTEVSILLVVAAPFVGSFLGLVIERLPQGRGIVLGRSLCDHCGETLRWFELVPIISWVAQRGRCRRCGARLGFYYPAIELAALGVAIWALLAVPAALVWPTAVLGWALLVLAEIDRQHFVLPDAITLPLVLAGLGLAAVMPSMQLLDHVIGAVVGFGALWLLAAVYRRLRGRHGLGQGDMKLLAAAGAWLGWQGLASVVLIAAVSGLAGTLALTLLRGGTRLSGSAAISFGPFLALGIWLTWVVGPIGPG